MNAWKAYNKPAAAKSLSVKTKPSSQDIAIEKASLRQYHDTKDQRTATDEEIDRQETLATLIAEQSSDELSERRAPARKSAR